ncbi:chromosome segregation protein SMC [Dermatophilus congolensis]|uniref:chromosome segregation protein SMC n=1 Tax=Dermatophilus congolensis TaxID=1863 RepID=UPI001AAE37E3|nr:chromosome segregation protein SMC [Dermatophilus congolensis]MBO3218160.1 chromosome segregation protein SMC [Dermatophilus congolensis]
MYVANLTLRGFKSFASATSFTLEPGITAVVGPNGSGKSNVVDALAWVMGEQGAKSLRGGKMEDVIFAGTSGRAPLGRAQVTMTIDNSDGALPIDYSEVTISRTMFRAGSSEYSINGTACRLLDIQELLSDSGIGKEMHVIVGQGRLDDVLRSTPEQRRGLIEEAAGVLKHRRRKEKALRKLETMEVNLSRVVDLAGEVRRRLGPLGRQAETARKAALWQAEVRDARLRLYADDLVQKQATLTQEQADHTALQARAIEVQAQLAHAKEAVAAATARAGEVTREAETLNEQTHQLQVLRDRFATYGRLATERLNSLQQMERATHNHTGKDPEALRAEAQKAREFEQTLTEEVEQARNDLETIRTERSSAEQAHAEERDRIAAVTKAFADRREGLAKLAGQVAAKQSRVETLESQWAASQAQIETATKKADEAEQEHHALQKQLSAEENESDIERQLARVREEHAAALQALSEAEQRHRQAMSERDRAHARCEAFEMGLRSMSDSQALLAHDAPPSWGTLASMITVNNGWETAIAAALGAAGEGVTYPTVEQAIEGLSHLRTVGDAGAAIVVADDELLPAATPESDCPGQRAIDLLTAKPDVHSVVAALLAKTVCVETVTEAVEYLSAHAPSTPHLRVVTRAGDIFAPGLVQAAGEPGSSRIEIAAARDEAHRHQEEASIRVEQAATVVADASCLAETLTDRLKHLTEELRKTDAEKAAKTAKLAALQATLRAATTQVQQLTAAAEKAASALAADRVALEEIHARHEAALAAPETEEPSTEQLARLEAAASTARAAETSCLLNLRTAEERLRASQGRADRLEAAARAEENARSEAARRRTVLQSKIQATALLREAAEHSVARITTSMEIGTSRRDGIATERQQVEGHLAAARGRTDQLAEELRTLTDTAHRDEMARAELRMRIENLLTKVTEEFGIGEDVLLDEYGPDKLVPPLEVASAMSTEAPENASTAAEDPGNTATPRKTRRRKSAQIPTEPRPYVREEQEAIVKDREKKLAKLGKVNPLALEEYAALEERHAFLNGQIEDLRAGKRDLLSIIADVDDRVQRAFMEAYEDTAREFAGVFSRLFPGGEGRLILTEPDSPLTTGIEVEARPPGKKVKRLSLLSGGERSLTAMALLVSIFKARPSPFYIMDEVEAALDDVNLGRLLMLFEELRESSQLIVITHQKRTMEKADALYGVTMRGDGVTRVVSQRLRNQHESPAADRASA